MKPRMLSPEGFATSVWMNFMSSFSTSSGISVSMFSEE